MSLDLCLPDLVKSGAITEARARIVQEKFDSLLKLYRGQMGEAAARGAATIRTVEQLAAEAAEKKRQTLLQTAAWTNAEAALASFKGVQRDGKWRDAALALFDRNWKGHATYQNVEALKSAVLAQTHAMMSGILDMHHRGFVTGMVRNKAELDDLGREAFGEATGSESAKLFAGAWSDTAEWLRRRRNAAGGNTGKLDRWGFPQKHHSQAVREVAETSPEYRALEADLAAARAGGDGAAEARIGEAMIDLASRTWRAFITPLLDRARMIDRETGLPFTPEALDSALDGVFRTIRTEGWEGRALGAMGGKTLANQMADHRFLIFDGWENWKAYHERFGEGTLFDVMMHHLERMSNDIAHLELLGPNPDATVRKLNDFVESKRALSPDSKARGQRSGNALISIDNMYAATSGRLSDPVDPDLARRMGSVRAYLTAAQLGRAVISAVPTDIGWSTLARIHRGLPITTAVADFARSFSKGERIEAIQTGLLAREASSLLNSKSRYVADERVGTASAWLAERTLRLSGLSPWTETAQWTFGRGMEGTLGRYAGRPLEQVPGRFQRMLREYGIDSASWDRIGATPLRKGKFMAGIDIADPGLRDRVLGMILTETKAAIPEQTATGRAILAGGAQRGTWLGETGFQQYKSFGVALILMQYQRMLSHEGLAGKLAYAAAVNAFLTTAGLLVVWTKDALNGDDLSPVSPATLGRAWLQGVGFGVFGDFLQASTSERAGALGTAFAGPTVGAAGELGTYAIGNLAETVQWLFDPDKKRDGSEKSWNEQTKFGRETVNILKRYNALPGTNLWYSRLATERLIFDQMQKQLDPGYEASWKAIARLHEEEGRGAWWERGELAPSRAPGLGKPVENEAAQ